MPGRTGWNDARSSEYWFCLSWKTILALFIDQKAREKNKTSRSREDVHHPCVFALLPTHTRTPRKHLQPSTLFTFIYTGSFPRSPLLSSLHKQCRSTASICHPFHLNCCVTCTAIGFLVAVPLSRLRFSIPHTRNVTGSNTASQRHKHRILNVYVQYRMRVN
ncbi:hypothetical protein PISMIDRAFT_146697 [Pisolithus microcarpus 441]|uniref:Uncharacterized protein n=1 Tax=Pisolithus microcarpus 441 TaxID=765257 RepID=A0A0D0A0J4_9AGAM|nr:hypothetical protein PISMIDRAFT_146697 [Pisolithus microcarpus 441]